MSTRLNISVAYAFLAASWCTSVEGQNLSLTYAIVDTDHAHLGSPSGLAGAFTWPVSSFVGVRFEYLHTSDRFDSFGSMCDGLIFGEFGGDDCIAQYRAESATLKSQALLVPLTLRLSHRTHVSFVPGVRWMHLASSQEGSLSARVRRASKTVTGLQFGIESGYALPTPTPLKITLGIYRASMPWFDDGTIIDGYAPFETTVNATWLEIGFTVSVARLFDPDR